MTQKVIDAKIIIKKTEIGAYEKGRADPGLAVVSGEQHLTIARAKESEGAERRKIFRHAGKARTAWRKCAASTANSAGIR